jgi:metal-responsive CopG/Arc/MetJ family transcriptional regulator
MSTAKVAVSMDQDLLAELDRLVAEQMFSSRSQAVQEAVREKLARARRHILAECQALQADIKRYRLAEECAKLDPAYEKGLAEEGMSAELAQWPEY